MTFAELLRFTEMLERGDAPDEQTIIKLRDMVEGMRLALFPTLAEIKDGWGEK